MFCPNCGNKLNGNEDFCSNCGNKMSVVKEQTIDTNEVNSPRQADYTMSEMMSKKSQNFIKPIIQKKRGLYL